MCETQNLVIFIYLFNYAAENFITNISCNTLISITWMGAIHQKIYIYSVLYKNKYK